ncbi:MAG TPA: hypothetical protein VK636_22555 [Gemmatimonadaceae bacterium]|nr:hypothetical protein [Gemmatimonadaceae bacterium]
MISVRPRRSVFLTLFGLCALTHSVVAQGDAKTGGTRAQLIARARVADSLGRKEEAFQIKARLANGDFEVGDRVLYLFETVPMQTAGGVTQQRIADSLIVQAGKIIRLKPELLGELNVSGFLLSELSDSVAARVAKYFKNATVRVDPLLRISASGAVGRAGVYYIPMDAPLGDLISRTGAGQHPMADMKNVTIKRGESVLYVAADVQSALGDGLTLQQLAIQPGDEVVVGSKSNKPWLVIVTTGLTIVAILIPILRSR